MNSKDKGNIGEAVALSEFTKKNIQVAVPFGDNARYDLIAEFNGKLNKIQVKYCNQLSATGSVSCPCASSTNHTTNKHYTTYENDVDYMVFYLACWDRIVIVPIEEVGDRKSLSFRLDAPLTKNQYAVQLVEDYTFDKIIKDI